MTRRANPKALTSTTSSLRSGTTPIYGASTVTSLSCSTGFSASGEADFLPGLAESCSACDDWLMLCSADAPGDTSFRASSTSLGR